MGLVMASSDSFHQSLDMDLSPSVQKQLCIKYSRLLAYIFEVTFIIAAEGSSDVPGVQAAGLPRKAEKV